MQRSQRRRYSSNKMSQIQANHIRQRRQYLCRMYKMNVTLIFNSTAKRRLSSSLIKASPEAMISFLKYTFICLIYPMA